MFSATGNQRKTTAALRWRLLTRGATLAAIVGGAALGYVWQKNKIHQLGYEIRQREQDVKALRAKQDLLQAKLAEIKSPRALLDKCQAWKIGLVVPKQSQIVRVNEPKLHDAPPPILFAEAPASTTQPIPPAPVKPTKLQTARNSPPPRHRGG